MKTYELGALSSIPEMYEYHKEKAGCGDVAAAILTLAEVLYRTPTLGSHGTPKPAETFRDTATPVTANGSIMEMKPGEFPATTTAWMNRHGVTLDHLEQVFHAENGKVSVIADTVSGSTKREQTVNCYVLEGVRAMLETGSAKFADADANALCERIGCLDKTNHAANRRSAGNKVTGSRNDGFTLVAPGLIHAAKLIKDIATPEAEGASE